MIVSWAVVPNVCADTTDERTMSTTADETMSLEPIGLRMETSGWKQDTRIGVRADPLRALPESAESALPLQSAPSERSAHDRGVRSVRSHPRRRGGVGPFGAADHPRFILRGQPQAIPREA